MMKNKMKISRRGVVESLLLFAGMGLLNGCCLFAEPENVALTGGGWALELDTLSGVERSWTEPDRDITLTIQPDGRFAGCAGVNRYFGKVEFDTVAHTLKFGNAGVTMMAGPGLEYESAYLKMLASVDSYEISGKRLFLKSNGRIVAEFDFEAPGEVLQ